MKLSKLFSKTTKDLPADEVSKNAQLLIKAGYVYKNMAGVYAMLPLGLKVINKIEEIVRQEMNRIGAQEVLMNALHPKKNWDTTGRWETFDVLFKVPSQTKAEYALASSHEEQVTPLAGLFIRSWKDLPEYDPENEVYPLCVYQFQTKFRDELRAKSGLLRGREFRMKDMYDFHQSEESLHKYYQAVIKAYLASYEQMGLKAYPVKASGGVFTSNFSHEFQTVCEAGEDNIYLVPGTDLFYNEEIAPSRVGKPNDSEEKELEKEDVYLPDVIGVEALSKALEIPVEKTTKTMFFEDKEKNFIVAVVRGDYSVNQEKLEKTHGKGGLVLAEEASVKQTTGCTIGYAGLLNLPNDPKIFIYVDDSLEGLKNFEGGTNKHGYHSKNLNFGRDVPLPGKFVDIKIVQDGDIHPDTGTKYEVKVSAEVGNIFPLGDKYTKAFGITYTDKDNQTKHPVMGCHGIGTTRCMAVIAEIYSDENGLKWPKNVAPFAYHLITHLTKKEEDKEVNEQIIQTAKEFYNSNPENVLWDDRQDVGIGFKLKEADLMGCPTQIIITKKSLQNGGVEVKDRAGGESKIMKIRDIQN
jgi:prolyl-tRNA synthetase